jgi:hypothetical protein
MGKSTISMVIFNSKLLVITIGIMWKSPTSTVVSPRFCRPCLAECLRGPARRCPLCRRLLHATTVEAGVFFRRKAWNMWEKATKTWKKHGKYGEIMKTR